MRSADPRPVKSLRGAQRYRHHGCGWGTSEMLNDEVLEADDQIGRRR
jgi:hypothetical protein